MSSVSLGIPVVRSTDGPDPARPGIDDPGFVQPTRPMSAIGG
ncbi:MAG: hypothetical protein ACRDSL_10910 [Pseudonocardiaceae bacterium]